MKFFLRLLCILLISFIGKVHAQSPSLGFNIGSTQNDVSYTVKVAPNGNMCIAGKFRGTMDLDPGAGVYNIASAGLDDIFLACYSPAGAFLWGGRIGGSSYDAAEKMTIDANSNVIIVGYYRGTNIDFDPGAGTFLLSDAGTSGSITFDGEGFTAKFSATGVFQWAKSLGGYTVYDCTFNADTDPQLNVYICGFFTDVMVVSPTITWSSGTTGKGYIIKYNAAGTLVWAKVFGLPGTSADDCEPLSMVVRNGYIYHVGVLQGAADFDPGPGTAILTASGLYDGYLAKWDTAGNYVNAIAITGVGSVDISNNLTGKTGDLFVSGNTNSGSVTFTSATGPGGASAAPGGGGNNDFYLARYDTNLNFVWGTITGGTGADFVYDIVANSSNLFVTGYFNNTVDFDPGAGTASMTSAGGDDIFINRYDLSGNYVCGFRAGSTGVDDGTGIDVDPSGNFYCTGSFNGTSVDFDPGAATYNLTSNGSGDAYLVKYAFSSASFTGTVAGDTICPGQTPYFTITTTGYAGPFTVSLSDGVTTQTYTGVYSGVPFAVSPAPTVTTTYSVTAITYTGADLCALPSPSSFGTATIVISTINAAINATAVDCNSITFTSVTTDSSYAWTYGDGTTSTLATNTHNYTDSGSFSVILTVTDTNGCVAHDTIGVSVSPPPLVFLGNDTAICNGNSVSLHSLFSYPTAVTYQWSTGATSASINVTTSGTYWLKVTRSGCSTTDTINVTVLAVPLVNIGSDTAFCIGNSITLTSAQPSGYTYQWNTGSTASSIVVSSTGTYWLRVTDVCSATDTIHITVSPPPVVELGPDTTSCNGLPISLSSSVVYTSPSYLWSTGATSSGISVTINGLYWLQVTQGGCSARDSIVVNIRYDTLHLYNRDTAICAGQVVQVFAGANPGATVQWLPTAGISASTTLNTLITPDTSAMYHVYVYLPGCPALTDSFFLDLQPNPIVYAGGNRTVCDHDTLHLSAAVSPQWYGDYIYSWSPALSLDITTAATAVFTPGANGKYVVTVTTANGCIGRDSATITVLPGDFIAPMADQAICPGDSALLRASGAIGYQWYPSYDAGTPIAADTWVYPISTQIFTVIGANANGCTDSQTVKVTVWPAGVIYMPDSVTIYPGETYQLDAAGNCSAFNWFPQTDLNNPYISNPVATPAGETRYTVTGVTEHGCKAYDSISIYLLNGGIVEVPNAFAPGSSANSKLFAYQQGMASLNYFRIFNRWGNLIFETKDFSEGWDGTYKGTPQMFDVYVYDLQAVSLDGNIVKKHGNITLIR